MKYTRELSYQASATQVHEMFMSVEYRDQVAAATGALDSKATIADGRVTIEQTQPVKGVPAFAKKFAGDSTRAIQREHWTSPTSASYEIETPGKPTSINGQVTLSENGGTTTARFDLEIKASVPLVGSKLEKLVAELTDEGYDLEQAVGQKWLAANS